MRLSTRGRYAVMAMAELAARQGAAHGPGGSPPKPVSLSDIAAAQMLSTAYLEQLFAGLKRAELVASARGPGGGYRLARPAEEIVIADIVMAVDEPIRATRCQEEAPGCVAGQKCLTHELWSELSDQIRIFLENMTLADVVCQRVRGRAAPPLKPLVALPVP